MMLRNILTRAGISGAAAAVTSAAAAAQLASANGSTLVAPLNAVTHCLWPDKAYGQLKFSKRYTITGAFIHLGSGIFWGVLFEKLRGAKASPLQDIAAATATAVIAYAVDYHVVPKRVTPGFEAHIPKRAFPVVYAALGLGLLFATVIGHRE